MYLMKEIIQGAERMKVENGVKVQYLKVLAMRLNYATRLSLPLSICRRQSRISTRRMTTARHR